MGCSLDTPAIWWTTTSPCLPEHDLYFEVQDLYFDRHCTNRHRNSAPQIKEISTGISVFWVKRKTNRFLVFGFVCKTEKQKTDCFYLFLLVFFVCLFFFYPGNRLLKRTLVGLVVKAHSGFKTRWVLTGSSHAPSTCNWLKRCRCSVGLIDTSGLMGLIEDGGDRVLLKEGYYDKL